MYSLKVRKKDEYPLLDFRSKVHDYENDIGYGKGSMVFHMFRRLVGDEAFQRGLQKVVAEGGGRELGWNDIAKLMVEGSGFTVACVCTKNSGPVAPPLKFPFCAPEASVSTYHPFVEKSAAFAVARPRK